MKKRKTRDLSALIIKRIRNVFISEGKDVSEEEIKMIIELYFDAVMNNLIVGKSVTIKASSKRLNFDIELQPLEDVDLKEEKPIFIKERADAVILLKCTGNFGIKRYHLIELTKKAINKFKKKYNYNKIKKAT